VLKNRIAAKTPCDIANVQALAGHKSIKTTRRYLRVSTELRREAVNRLRFPEPGAHVKKASTSA
jgi:integrase